VNSPSVIVVGAGIIGCAVAHELAASGARVHVIDARKPGQGATRASAGVLAPYIEGHEGPLRDLGARSLSLYDDFITRVGADSGRDVVFQRNGTFEVAFEQDEVVRLSQASARLHDEGIEVRWVTPAQFDKFEPLIASTPRVALLIPNQGFVGVTSLTMALAAAADKKGATFANETGAIRIHQRPGGRVAVTTAKSTLDADRVVLAAGSWSSQITVDGVSPIPVKPIRGQLIELKYEPGRIQHIIWGSAGYLVPWPNGSVLVGGTVEDVGFDEESTREGVNKMKAAAAMLVPALAHAPMNTVRVGLRPKGPDDLPMIGASKVIGGLVYATAHYRNGVLLAPLTVKLVKQLVLGDAGDPALATLTPERHGHF
jgi:glycine oxidase